MKIVKDLKVVFVDFLDGSRIEVGDDVLGGIVLDLKVIEDKRGEKFIEVIYFENDGAGSYYLNERGMEVEEDDIDFEIF
jgi:hypothetical protein